MRASVAIGLFLLLGGFLVVTLHPVYETGHPAITPVESTAPDLTTAPMPPWLGLSAMAAGAALLTSAWWRRPHR